MNMRFPILEKVWVTLGLALFSTSFAFGQLTIRGKVTDASTGEGLSGVSIMVLNTSRGTSTDSSGQYLLTVNEPAGQIRFAALGYKTLVKSVPEGRSLTINAELEEDAQVLDEVTVSGKGRYRNRDNPAVNLIRKVIEHKAANRLTRFDYASFQVYEKIMMAVSDVPRFVANNALTRGYRFAFENVDTTLVPGRRLLPIYLEENLSHRYQRLHPKAEKTIVTANKKTELDKRYINNQNLETYFKF